VETTKFILNTELGKLLLIAAEQGLGGIPGCWRHLEQLSGRARFDVEDSATGRQKFRQWAIEQIETVYVTPEEREEAKKEFGKKFAETFN
jgi:hypothetical protein